MARKLYFLYDRIASVYNDRNPFMIFSHTKSRCYLRSKFNTKSKLKYSTSPSILLHDLLYYLINKHEGATCTAQNARQKILIKILFCRECGSKFQLSCPECSAGILSSDKFCGKCGHPLEKHTHDEVCRLFEATILHAKIPSRKNIKPKRLRRRAQACYGFVCRCGQLTAMSERLEVQREVPRSWTAALHR